MSASALQLIVLAAGKGVRMRSELPKVLHKVCGRTLVERALRAAAPLHPVRAVVVIGYGEQLLREELKRIGERDAFQDVPLLPVLQAEQHGTGHAVQMTSSELKDDAPLVLIMPGDCPLITASDLQRFVDEHRSAGSTLSFLTAEIENPDGFGRVLRDASGKVLGIVEHKDASPAQRTVREINSSIYLCDLALLREGLAALRNDNAQKEYYLTDIVPFAVSRGEKVGAVLLTNSQAVLGANNRAELSALETLRRSELNRYWMEAGVTLEDPAATYIDEDVTIGTDSYIGAGTRLQGSTAIGSRVRVDGNALITESRIGDRAHIKLSCVIDSSEVGPHCHIGPFAHLRPGSQLRENVKIGNFVETKKTIMERGAKANHLTYLGDAHIGAEANVGAGTITCNYDGSKKSNTEIGAGAFIGSNSCLVAPVKIGDGSYIGAGSTITKDVPDGALAVARARQENIEGWVTRKKNQSNTLRK